MLTFSSAMTTAGRLTNPAPIRANVQELYLIFVLWLLLGLGCTTPILTGRRQQFKPIGTSRAKALSKFSSNCNQATYKCNADLGSSRSPRLFVPLGQNSPVRFGQNPPSDFGRKEGEFIKRD